MSEEVLRFGPAGALVGVLTAPARSPAVAPPAVILLNAGLVHHAGPSRLWVRVARELSERGFTALRMDFSGIGDSPPRRDTIPFEKSAVEEVRAAMDALEARGAQTFVLLGLCSGAEIAFKTACADERVVAAALINAPRYMEEPSAELIAYLEGRQAERYYWRIAARRRGSWLKALRGGVEFGSIARAVAARVRGLLFRDRRSFPGAENDAAGFRLLAQRGVRLLVVFSEGDWGYDFLQAVLGPDLDRLAAGGLARMEVLPACDHLLTPIRSQERLLALLSEWLREPAP